MTKTLIYISSIILLCANVLFGQSDVQTITDEIVENFKYKPRNNIEINAERADIFITGADIEEIQIKAIVVSKNASKSEARTDLSKMKVLSEKLGKTIYLRNYISVKDLDNKPNSNLKVVFEIKLPRACPVNIKNSFGQIMVTNLNAQVVIDSKYTKIDLSYLEGNGKVKSVLGDVNMHSSYGEFQFDLSRCDVVLQNSDGNYSIDSKYGSVTATVKPELEKLVVVGETVDVNLNMENLSSSYYNLSSKGGKIIVDQNFNIETKTKEKGDFILLELNKNIDCSRLNIDTHFGNISLIKPNNQ